jgi:hypothetical protein
MELLQLENGNISYFWNHEYRHEMRTLKTEKQIEIYQEFIEWGLDPVGKSDLHKEIIDSVIGDFTIQGEPESARLNRIASSY